VGEGGLGLGYSSASAEVALRLRELLPLLLEASWHLVLHHDSLYLLRPACCIDGRLELTLMLSRLKTLRRVE